MATNTARWLMVGFLIAFVIKAPMVPLHTWLPEAAEQATPGSSTLMVGVLDKIAADIDAMAAKGGESVIAVIGHADRRGSREYNQALGMRRAKAVFDAIAAKLAPATKARLRVDIDNSLSAPTGLHGSSR